MRGKRKDKKKGNEESIFDEPRQSEPRRITPVEIQQKEFRLAMRGYHERDVDEFLDAVTEEVARLYAENKRLHEEAESRGARPAGGASTGEAESIVRQARQEAARIVAEGEARARALTGAVGPGAAPGGGVPAGSTSPLTGAALAGFLSREKSFLQNLAKMMQDHANAMKEDVRRVRDSATRSTTAGAIGSSQAAGSSAAAARPSEASPSTPGRREPEPGHDPWRPPAEPSAPPPSAPPAPSAAIGSEAPADEGDRADQPPYFMDESARPAVDDLKDVEGTSDAQAASPQEPHPHLDEPTREWALDEASLDEGAFEEGAIEGSDAHIPVPRQSPGRRASAPGVRWTPQPEEEAPGDERSLKELFWGED